ncbi:MAG TPA: endonuclease/exonuclease/phosphatase family protein [Aeromicrobium sp.]|nr:endonuclease/exonuclease/phosphatase family protein [Aeromicrobium sp.]
MSIRIVRAAVVGLVISLASSMAPAFAAEPIQVGTYNIRNPDSSTPAPWDQRLPGIVQNILAEGVSVLGVQELYGADERKEFLKALNTAAGDPTAYDMSRPANDSGGYDNRIVYDTRLVQRVAADAITFANQQVGDTRREMAWAVFQRVNGGQFLVVNTHLCPTSDPVTAAQWTELIGHTAALRAAYGGIPVLAIGDFNTTKFEPPAKKNLKLMRRNGFGDVLGQTYRSYRVKGARAVGAERIDANFGSSNAKPVGRKKNGNSIDWIFASNQLDVLRYRVVVRRDLSDHNMVTSTIVLP